MDVLPQPEGPMMANTFWKGGGREGGRGDETQSLAFVYCYQVLLPLSSSALPSTPSHCILTLLLYLLRANDCRNVIEVSNALSLPPSPSPPASHPFLTTSTQVLSINSGRWKEGGREGGREGGTYSSLPSFLPVQGGQFRKCHRGGRVSCPSSDGH